MAITGHTLNENPLFECIALAKNQLKLTHSSTGCGHLLNVSVTFQMSELDA